ncbi:hypothetical protein [Rhizobium sp.]|uniref:hypothetical protein n=1 Tax=Rhizobium sp. TaxID=391 RepID=UPI0028ABBAE9
MSRRKGELTPASIDRGWPYQIALLASLCQGQHSVRHAEFCKKLLRCHRGHSVFHEDQHYDVHCFAVKAHAEAFLAEFGGEWFDPAERGKGVNWNKWYKGTGGKRFSRPDPT